MNKYFLTILIITGISNSIFGQERNDTHSGILVDFFFTARGVGGGLSYSFGEDRKNYVISLDFTSVKDERESLVIPAFGRELGRKYVYGKLNYFHILSPSFGLNYNLIPKSELNYANVRTILKIGPAFGLLSPYYVEIYDPNNPGVTIDSRVVEPFDPDQHNYNRIFGRARLFASDLNLNTRLGLSLKALMLFDFAPNQRYIHGISLGLNTDFFFSPVPIMAELDKLQNQRIFVVGSLGFIVGNRW